MKISMTCDFKLTLDSSVNFNLRWEVVRWITKQLIKQLSLSHSFLLEKNLKTYLHNFPHCFNKITTITHTISIKDLDEEHREMNQLPRTKALAVFAFVNELLVNEVERNIYETSVSIPWFIQLLLLFLLICSSQPRKSQISRKVITRDLRNGIK